DSINDGSSDNCDFDLELASSQTLFTCADLGANNVTLTVTDDSGNADAAVATVTVLDTVSPTALTSAFTLHLDATGSATLYADSIDGGSTDNCDPELTLDASQTSFTCDDLGANNITLTVTDDSGNNSSTSASVMVLDTISPIMSVQSFTLNMSSVGLILVADSADTGTTDNCTSADSLSWAFTPPAFTCDDLGTNSVLVQVTDAFGNSSSQTITVTVATSDIDSDDILDCADLCTDTNALNFAADPSEACDFSVDMSGDSISACKAEQRALYLPTLFGPPASSGWEYGAQIGEGDNFTVSVTGDSLHIDFETPGLGSGVINLSATNNGVTYTGDLNVDEWSYPYRSGPIQELAASSASANDGAMVFPMLGNYGEEVSVMIDSDSVMTALMTLTMEQGSHTIHGYINSKGCYMSEPAALTVTASEVTLVPVTLNSPLEDSSPVPSDNPTPLVIGIPHKKCD
ncbi:hypothetical protein N9F63_00495, partial [bacterium]|nr:hypothetical protein [bacterium]